MTEAANGSAAAHTRIHRDAHTRTHTHTEPLHTPLLPHTHTHTHTATRNSVPSRDTTVRRRKMTSSCVGAGGEKKVPTQKNFEIAPCTAFTAYTTNPIVLCCCFGASIRTEVDTLPPLCQQRLC